MPTSTWYHQCWDTFNDMISLAKAMKALYTKWRFKASPKKTTNCGPTDLFLQPPDPSSWVNAETCGDVRHVLICCSYDLWRLSYSLSSAFWCSPELASTYPSCMPQTSPTKRKRLMPAHLSQHIMRRAQRLCVSSTNNQCVPHFAGWAQSGWGCRRCDVKTCQEIWQDMSKHTYKKSPRTWTRNI